MEATMKAQVSSLTRTTNNKRSRTKLAMVAGLIVLAVAIVGAARVLSQRAQAPQITSGAAAQRPLIAYCRVCGDEALAAHQPSMPASARAAKPAPTGFSVRSLITNCRACRDEALAGTQASFGTVDSRTVFLQLDDPHQPGPR